MYETLRQVLDDVIVRVSEGKGLERHATNAPFEQQPLLVDARVSGLGGPVYQARKKPREALTLAAAGQYLAATNELLDAIAYNAAGVILLREAMTPPDATKHPWLEVGGTYQVDTGETIFIQSQEVAPDGRHMFHDRYANSYTADGVPFNGKGPRIVLRFEH